MGGQKAYRPFADKRVKVAMDGVHWFFERRAFNSFREKILYAYDFLPSVGLAFLYDSVFSLKAKIDNVN